MKHEKTDNTQKTPDDRLVSPCFSFKKPASEHIKKCFAKIHANSERTYLGNGVWAEHDPKILDKLPARSRPLNVIDPKFPPLYRTTAWRIIGYAHAYNAVKNKLYLKRMIEGGEYLLKEQQTDGSFLYWRGREDGSPGSHHLLFSTGNPGCAFVELYRITGDEKYLRASKKGADWASAYPVSKNNNYNSFAILHLCEHYRETGEEKYLASALEKTIEGVYPRQMPCGGWPGHNSWIFYHSIIIRGFAALYGILPDGHSEKDRLRGRFIAAINHMARQQTEKGLLISCHDPEEWLASRKPESGYSIHPREKVCPWAVDALICVLKWTPFDVKNILYGLLSAEPRDELAQGQEGMMHLAYGSALGWMETKEN